MPYLPSTDSIASVRIRASTELFVKVKTALLEFARGDLELLLVGRLLGGLKIDYVGCLVQVVTHILLFRSVVKVVVSFISLVLSLETTATESTSYTLL